MFRKKEVDLELGKGTLMDFSMHENFDVDTEKLISLVQSREEGTAKLKEMGGVEAVAQALKVDVSKGIREDTVEYRRFTFGANSFPKKEMEPFYKIFFEALQDRTLIILCIASAVSIVLGLTVEDPKTGWIEGTAILLAVLIVATVTSANDYSKEKKFRKLNDIVSDRKVSVLREGTALQVSIYDLLVGDVVLLEAGDFVPADGLYIDGSHLRVDESSQTGEPDAVKKDPQRPFMISGCKVMEGKGRMLVIAVGVHSLVGRTKALLETESDDTPLQQKLGALAEKIGKLGVIAAGLTFAALLLIWIGDIVINDKSFHAKDLTAVVHFFIIGVTIIVVAVPEGLPMAVTISLAYSMFKMMKDNNLVRKLEACETMGGATNICSDKTGTLTQNRMTVVKALFGFRDYKDVRDLKNLPKNVLDLLNESIAANSSAFISEVDGKKEYVGNKTECALLDLSTKLGYDYTILRGAAQVVEQFPFSSDTKRMGTVVRTSNPNFHQFFVKGAAEIILGLCTKYLDEHGHEQALDESHRKIAADKILSMASEGLRVLCLAYTVVRDQSDWTVPPEQDLTLLCFVGIKDPLREDVPDAVRVCKNAGIFVRMVTGDNALTARQIAKECGILTEGGEVMEGPKFRQLTDAQLDAVLPRLQVLARSSPEDKFKLVKRLRAMGEVVAATGDGTNDAPQLKEADVGFSMGIAGTEVAKEASDIVLLDDNFSSIVNAVKWGRNVYDSIRKFLQFQLTVNTCAVVIAFIGAVSTGSSPLKAIQMLWVNLIMDTMAALALATEQPTDELLKRKPYGRDDNIITNKMWRFVIGHASFQLVVLFTLLWFGHKMPFLDLPDKSTWTKADTLRHGTIIFNTFVLCQLFNEINARKLENELNCFQGIFTNLIFHGVLVFTIGVQVLLVQFGGDFAGCRPLNAQQWFVCIIIALFELPFGILLRFVPVPAEGEPMFPFLQRLPFFNKTKTLGVEKYGLLDSAADEEDVENGEEKSVAVLPMMNDDRQRARELWKRAQRVRTQVGVVQAFRRFRR